MKSNAVVAFLVGLMLLSSGVMVARIAPAEDEAQYLPLVKAMWAGDSAHAHEAITHFEGPETCVRCHQKEAEQMHGSVHYQQSGPTPNVLNISGSAGKSDGAFNTYCGTIETSRFATCAGPSVSYRA